jgi:hypothetical protein
MEVRIDRGRGEVAVETEVFILLFWLVREFINKDLRTGLLLTRVKDGWFFR